MAKVLVVYWSGTGNTQIMAEKIAEGLEIAGAEVDLREVSDVDPEELIDYDKVAFGCPSMGSEVLEEEEFEPFFEECEPEIDGLPVALFGSYGWGDGEWMRNWVDRAEDAGADVFRGEGLIIQETPDEDGEEDCIEFGEEFADF